MSEHYPFDLAPLPYAYDALEPCIDTLTVAIHHDAHQAGYVENLNKTLKDYPQFQCWPLEKLIIEYPALPKCIQADVLRNAGGVYAHELYFDGMTSPKRSKCPTGKLAEAIDCSFTSMEAFRDMMTQTALKQFGSGWAWLAGDCYGRLHVISTPNQETPFSRGLRPVLCIDVWEHAYYLKYKNKRADYIKAWWNLIDWEFANENYLPQYSAF